MFASAYEKPVMRGAGGSKRLQTMDWYCLFCWFLVRNRDIDIKVLFDQIIRTFENSERDLEKWRGDRQSSSDTTVAELKGWASG